MRRRRWLALAALPFAAGGQASGLAAPKLTPLTEAHAEARQLGYRTDARRVVASDFPEYEAGRRCGNCQLSFDDARGRVCALFPGHTVSVDGWCKAWVKPLLED